MQAVSVGLERRVIHDNSPAGDQDSFMGWEAVIEDHFLFVKS